MMMLSAYYQGGTVGDSAIVRLNIKRNHSTRTEMSSTEEEEGKKKNQNNIISG